MRHVLNGVLLSAMFCALCGTAPAADEVAVAIVDKAIAAHGGEQRLRAVRAIRWESQGTMDPDKVPSAFTNRVTVQGLDRYRADFEWGFNGTKYKTVTETHYKALMSNTVLVADGKEVQVSRRDGKAVDPKDLPKLLGKETPVLVFAQGEIDPYYLQVIEDQVLIIVIPASKEFPGRNKADK